MDEKNQSTDIIKNIHKNELIDNNSFYDITGNMNVWRIHETYEGSGNETLWEAIHKKALNLK